MQIKTRPPENKGHHKSSQTRISLPAWWRAFRYHFVPSSFLPAILGGVVAWTQTGIIHKWFFFLVVLGVTLNHIALNMTDDYFDYRASVDQKNKKTVNPYAGGSGTLTSGKIKPQDMRFVFTSFYVLTMIIGLYLCAARTWWLLAFGLFGMASSYFYTAPPIRYGYRGFGEFSQLVNFSLTIGLGAYVVQTVFFSWEAFWVLLPLGLMMFAMIIINEIPDRKDDATAGKNNLVVLFGAKKAVRLYAAAMIAAYLVILFTPLFHLTSYWIYLALFTLPWSARASVILKRNISDTSRLAPANLLTIRAHNLTGILLIVAYLIEGIKNNHDFDPIFFTAFVLAVFYIPAAISLFFKNFDKK
ncbi:MAG TPA: prenyltransferase [Smithellaceae bacterium]|jgi:1,4-dihydroxy-2-naphthoate octaprenyltransferase|nr:prenyltransferase [Smithellaceae bacterium]HOM70463.1 prenyltransferase [Smithellaceae bacterium]HOS08289.1 prenyltransferase [Smithellaceae bacterium]HOU04057.1 prenyltransferase [Smithellaceae bacterium]HPD48900.1 prenyltransferase [Smithellaceae bacterium]